MLGDLYLMKRDYENALANYINSLVIVDFDENTYEKAQYI